MEFAMPLLSGFPCCRLFGRLSPWRSWVTGGLLLAVLATTNRAEGPDDRFIDIYNLIQQADQSGDKRAARQLYEQAQEKLRAMQRDYPSWNERVINYRLRYTADKLSSLASLPLEPAKSVDASTAPPTAVAPSGEVITQFNELTQQIRLLQTDKQSLEAKLREALSAKPAPVDPREFQAAIERIASLQQTNKSLISTLQQQQAERANLIDKVVAEETQKSLAEANQALATQREKARQLDQERADAAAELKRLQEQSVIPLKLENSILKSQVYELKSVTAKGRQVAELSAQVTRLETSLKDLKQDNARLISDRASMEKQLEDLRAKSAEEGIVKIAQLESQLAVAKSDSARQTARVEEITARLAQEKQARAELQAENQNLTRRVADLAATSAGDAQVKKELQEALTLEKTERAQAEAALKSAEMKLASLQAGIANPTRATSPASPAADAAAEAAGAALQRDSQVKGLQAEVEKLRETVKASVQRETEFSTALSLEASLRRRIEKEKGDLEQRLAAASVELAANRVEKTREAGSVAGHGNGGVGSTQPVRELESRVQSLEREREDLRERLTRLTQAPAFGLTATKMRRAVSPRDRASEFLQYRQLKAFAPLPPAESATFPVPVRPASPK